MDICIDTTMYSSSRRIPLIIKPSQKDSRAVCRQQTVWSAPKPVKDGALHARELCDMAHRTLHPPTLDYTRLCTPAISFQHLERQEPPGSCCIHLSHRAIEALAASLLRKTDALTRWL